MTDTTPLRPADRIVELRRVPVSEIVRNEANWREHPTEQVSALRAVLAEIGFADVLLAVERKVGRKKTLRLVDGHARLDELADDYEVPVLVLDLDDEEEATMLAVLDPLAAMAKTNPVSLLSLLSSIETENDELGALLARLADDAETELRIRSATGDFDPNAEWVGMPEFEQNSAQSAFSTTIHFATHDDADRFFELIERERKSSLWWPASDGLVGSDINQAYVLDTGDDEDES